ncbi:MAG: hypothetical protein WBG87_13075, partial [Stenotrophomonas maltophilia]
TSRFHGGHLPASGRHYRIPHRTRIAPVAANLGWHTPSDRGAASSVPTKVGTYQRRVWAGT